MAGGGGGVTGALDGRPEGVWPYPRARFPGGAWGGDLAGVLARGSPPTPGCGMGGRWGEGLKRAPGSPAASGLQGPLQGPQGM
jgi:hypothetical protein